MVLGFGIIRRPGWTGFELSDAGALEEYTGKI